MKVFEWNLAKNEILKKTRNVSFEDVLVAISEKKYPNQEILIVEINNYAYLVPFVKDKDKIFLKTIIPNNKATKNVIYPEILVVYKLFTPFLLMRSI